MARTAQLKARVEAALDRIAQQAETRQGFDEKLLGLIDVMERGLTRKQAEIREQRASFEALQAEHAAVAQSQEALRAENARLAARAEALEAENSELKAGLAAREGETAELAGLLESLLTALDEQGESRLLQTLEELAGRAGGLVGEPQAAVAPLAEAPVAEETTPDELEIEEIDLEEPVAEETAADAGEALPEAVPAAKAVTPETPCSPEMAAVIEGYDRKAAGTDAGEAVAASADLPEADAGELVAEAAEPADEALEIAAEAAETSEEPPAIVAEAESAEAEPETPSIPMSGGELTLEAIGELLKEKESLAQAGNGGSPESVRTIIDRVNALADEMADPGGDMAALARAAEAQDAGEAVEGEAEAEAKDQDKVAKAG